MRNKKTAENKKASLKKSRNRASKKVLRPLQSTQQNVPIADISNGVITRTDGEMFKMMEVKPVPFMLKNVKDRNMIWYSFESALKICPKEFHIKAMGLPADLSTQINLARKNIDEEANASCQTIGAEYVIHLREIEKDKMQHKFYMFFPYIPETRMTQKEMYRDAVVQLEQDKDNVAAYLERCGNKVVMQSDVDDQIATYEMIYRMYHRDAKVDSFRKNYSQIFTKYQTALKTDDFYLPPAEVLAPNIISYLDSKYLKIGNTYYSFMYFTSDGYPKYAYAGWLDAFINSYAGVDVDIFFKRRDSEGKKDSMRRVMSHAMVGGSENIESTEAGENSIRNYQSADYILNMLNEGYDLYDAAVMITITGASPTEIDLKMKGLKSIASSSNLKLYPLRYQCEEAFNACLPCGTLPNDLFRKMRRNMMTDGAATLYPFTTFELIDDDGLNIGESNGAPVIPDFFNRTVFDNPNIFICGKSGAGKSASLMQIAIRARIKHIHVYILAPEKQNEFKRLCARIGGQFVTIGSGSPDRINMFDVRIPDRKTIRNNQILNGDMEKDDTGSNQILARIGWLQSFFKLYLEDELSHTDEDILNTAIISTYKAKGIDVNDEATVWADQWHTQYKEMPIMQDLVNELRKINGGQKLAMSLNTLVTGAGSYFNGHTNVDIDNEFVVFGLEGNQDQFLGPAMYMALEFTWDKIRNDRSQEKMLIMDEWWRMAFDEIAAERSMKIARLSRGLGCSTVIATQQMNDIMAYEDGKYGKAVINNCATKIIMGLEDEEIKSVRRIIDLSSTELAQIKKFRPGNALLIAGTTRMIMRFTPTETEKLLVFNDEKTLREYRKRVEEEAERRRAEEERRNARPVDEIFVTPFDTEPAAEAESAAPAVENKPADNNNSAVENITPVNKAESITAAPNDDISAAQEDSSADLSGMENTENQDGSDSDDDSLFDFNVFSNDLFSDSDSTEKDDAGSSSSTDDSAEDLPDITEIFKFDEDDGDDSSGGKKK